MLGAGHWGMQRCASKACEQKSRGHAGSMRQSGAGLPTCVTDFTPARPCSRWHALGPARPCSQ
eukprot:22039-Chlamydomonas_euryale.AAC.3